METDTRDKVIGIAAMADGHLLSDSRAGIPWELPRDRTFFRNQTKGQKLLLGRVTYDEMRGWFQDDHLPCLVSRNSDTVSLERAHHTAASSVSAGIERLNALRSGPIYVCGGAKIYDLALPLCDELLLTRVNGRFDGDRFFPAWESTFRLVSSESFPPDKWNACGMSIEKWVRNTH